MGGKGVIDGIEGLGGSVNGGGVADRRLGVGNLRCDGGWKEGGGDNFVGENHVVVVRRVTNFDGNFVGGNGIDGERQRGQRRDCGNRGQGVGGSEEVADFRRMDEGWEWGAGVEVH